MPTNWDNRVQPNTTWGSRTSPTTNWDNRVGYLLKEDTFYLLLENGFKIVLSGVTAPSTDWTNRTAI